MNLTTLTGKSLKEMKRRGDGEERRGEEVKRRGEERKWNNRTPMLPKPWLTCHESPEALQSSFPGLGWGVMGWGWGGFGVGGSGVLCGGLGGWIWAILIIQAFYLLLKCLLVEQWSWTLSIIVWKHRVLLPHESYIILPGYWWVSYSAWTQTNRTQIKWDKQRYK